MAHPLNRPRLRPVATARSCEGYGILQPRVSSSLPGSGSFDLCAPATAGDPVSIRTRAPSPTSTRICSARARSSARASTTSTRSSRSLDGRLPENRILSHDLLEGCYARSGLLSDVELFEESPVALRRRRRAPPPLDPRRLADRGWLLPWVPVSDGACAKPAVGAVAAGRSLDNLRRSLAPVALLLLLLAGMAALPSPKLWTDGHRRVISRRQFSASCSSCSASRRTVCCDCTSQQLWRSSVGASALACALASLPHEAFVNADAVLRTTWRMLVPHDDGSHWSPFGAQTRGLRARAAGVVSGDVGWPGCCDGDHCWTGGAEADGAAAGRHRYSRCGLSAPGITRWVSRPLRAARAASQAQPGSLSPHAGAATWACLRDLRRTGGQLAAAGQLPGAAGGRSSRIAHRRPTWAWRCSPTLTAYDFGYLDRRGARSSARPTRFAAWCRSSGTAVISTTGTTRGPCSRCRQCTSRRSTAEIWRAMC